MNRLPLKKQQVSGKIDPVSCNFSVKEVLAPSGLSAKLPKTRLEVMILKPAQQVESNTIPNQKSGL
jgi:hypothetical protein